MLGAAILLVIALLTLPAAVAGEKAGPVAARAAELTAEAGHKIAERSRDLATELRRDQAARGEAPEPGMTPPAAPTDPATGPGAEMRQSLGTAVVSGMIGVTIFGLIFTPVFYVVTRWLSSKLPQGKKPTPKSNVTEAVRYDQTSSLTDPDAPAPAAGRGGDF